MGLKLPKLKPITEHIFYVLEGAALRVFGDDSPDIYEEVGLRDMMASLCYSVVYSFTKYTLEEAELDGVKPKTMKDKASVASQMMLTRRCIFPHLYNSLLDCYTQDFIISAIEEDMEHKSGDKRIYNDAITASIADAINEFCDSPTLSSYLDASDHNLKLEKVNLKRWIKHCRFYTDGKRVPLESLTSQTLINRYIGNQLGAMKTRFPEEINL